MGEKSAFFTVCFSSVREGLNIIIRGIVGFCFGDRDFVTSSPLITSFSFSEKEKEVIGDAVGKSLLQKQNPTAIKSKSLL